MADAHAAAVAAKGSRAVVVEGVYLDLARAKNFAARHGIEGWSAESLVGCDIHSADLRWAFVLLDGADGTPGLSCASGIGTCGDESRCYWSRSSGSAS